MMNRLTNCRLGLASTPDRYSSHRRFFLFRLLMVFLFCLFRLKPQDRYEPLVCYLDLLLALQLQIYFSVQHLDEAKSQLYLVLVRWLVCLFLVLLLVLVELYFAVFVLFVYFVVLVFVVASLFVADFVVVLVVKKLFAVALLLPLAVLALILALSGHACHRLESFCLTCFWCVYLSVLLQDLSPM